MAKKDIVEKWDKIEGACLKGEEAFLYFSSFIQLTLLEIAHKNEVDSSFYNDSEIGSLANRDLFMSDFSLLKTDKKAKNDLLLNLSDFAYSQNQSFLDKTSKKASPALRSIFFDELNKALMSLLKVSYFDLVSLS